MVTPAKALHQAWRELNAIRARDGAPQILDWGPRGPIQTDSCTHEWFSQVVDDCAAAYKQLTGCDIQPWHKDEP